MSKFTRMAAAAIIAAATGQAAMAKDYVFSSFLSPDMQISKWMHTPWADAVKERTNGEVNFEVYYGGAILPGVGVLQGVAQGVAAGGFITMGYVPAQVPLWASIGDAAWKSNNDFAVTLAATEWGMLDPYASAEMLGNGVVFTGSAATALYAFHCRGEPKTLADYKNLRIRTAGGAFARFVESIGAVPVNVPYTETYAALERGALDCTALDPTHLINGAAVAEVVDSITPLNMAPFFAQAVWAFNKDVWSGLTTDQKRIMLEESARAIVRLHQGQDKMVADNIAQGQAKGVKLIEPSADLVAAKAAFVADDIGGLTKITEERGVKNFKEAYAGFSASLAKWEGLLAKVDRNDSEAMYKLIMDEIYNKIDLATYGMK